jgi:hypothetical protein
MRAHHALVLHPITMRRTLALFALGLAAAAMSSTAVRAQSAPTRIISVNPFLPLTGSFQGEFEQKLRENLSVAVSASYIALDDDSERLTNADVKLRLYPSEKALQGFGFAAGLGVGRQSEVEYFACPAIYPGGACNNQRRSVTGPTFSVEMQYQWLLGSKRNTAVTIGGGAKRYFIDNSPYEYEVYDDFLPTLRLTIGYAFR